MSTTYEDLLEVTMMPRATYVDTIQVSKALKKSGKGIRKTRDMEFTREINSLICKIKAAYEQEANLIYKLETICLNSSHIEELRQKLINVQFKKKSIKFTLDTFIEMQTYYS